jgi:hypothetical protein
MFTPETWAQITGVLLMLYVMKRNHRINREY